MLAVMKKLTYDEEYNFENEVLCEQTGKCNLNYM